MKLHSITRTFNTLYILFFVMLAFRCTEDPLMLDAPLSPVPAELNTMSLSTTENITCHDCDYVVPAGNPIVDGNVLQLKPGSVIGLSAAITYKNISFRNIIGTPDQPIIIKNCGGIARINGTGTGYSIKTANSRYFRITGEMQDQSYGIVITGGQMSINLGGLSTNFEVDHIEISNSGFAGIMAKTDPTCNDATIRENFLMEDVALHHNFIHDTGGEGIYAGNSWYSGMNTACGKRLPHEIHNIHIYRNVVQNTGWDAIQLGCATRGASIYNNTVENYGTKNKTSQNSGIQISSGTGGLCYNNLIRQGSGNGLIVNGLGDNLIFNNIIDRPGNHGVFCDERASPGPGYQFINNTILNPGADGIRIYAEHVPLNVMINNIIANPGSYSSYDYPRSPEDAFVYRLNDDVKIDMANNYFTTDMASLMIRTSQSGYQMEYGSPAIDKGRDVSGYTDMRTDFYGHSRLSGVRHDIGAVESNTGTGNPANIAPIANAGQNQKLVLPTNTTRLAGTGTDRDGTITSYTWTQYGGPTVELINANTPTATVRGLTEGKYYFRLTVKDNAGASHYDNMLINVAAPLSDNIAPVANAGPNKTIMLPRNTLSLSGTATDSDGFITAYRWTQYGGPTATLTNDKTAMTSLKLPVAGRYYFRLTVKDNDGATHEDNVLVRVEG